MAKIILITGTGKGKSYIAQSLARSFTAQEIPHSIFELAEYSHLELYKTLLRDIGHEGYIIVIKPPGYYWFTDPRLRPWQLIEITGGEDLTRPIDEQTKSPSVPPLSGVEDDSQSRERGCPDLCNALLDAISRAAQGCRLHHARARRDKRDTMP